MLKEAIAARLRERDERLLRACEAANRDPDVASIEQGWGALAEGITGPWTDPEPTNVSKV